VFLLENYYAVKCFSTFWKSEHSRVNPKIVKKNTKTFFVKRFLDIYKMSIFSGDVDFFIYFLQLLQNSLYSKIYVIKKCLKYLPYISYRKQKNKNYAAKTQKKSWEN
jgi:hypothetical protein